MYLRQSTASQEVPLGYFLDSTDGDTEETALTIANTDIKIWKFGATTLANKNSGGATHISNGVYYAVLDATDTNTVGPLVIFVHVAGALAVRLECHVLEEPVYDGLFASGANYSAQTGDSFARLGAPAGASISADVATVDANVDAILIDTGTTLETHLTDIKGTTFSGATDSLEAIRNRGDSAWTTAASGLEVNVTQINGVTITGDGSGTPYDVA